MNGNSKSKLQSCRFIRWKIRENNGLYAQGLRHGRLRADSDNVWGGGNTEPKIMEEIVFKEPFALDEQNSCIRHETIGCQTTDGSSPKHNNRIVEPILREYRVRKLTEKECGRLMGVKDNDIEKIGKNLSRSAQYHCFGDSIVTTCLMAIFGQLLGQNQAEIETKIQTTINEIRSGNNGKQQTTDTK